MDKDQYLISCNKQLLNMFELTKQNQISDRQKFRLEGYMQAGIELGIFTKEQADKIMNRAHRQVFTEDSETESEQVTATS
ncbi:hypothetical protein [Thalassotalea mangrovi]|uniref:Uncharacterized protein n=1 Tax=Thalassotalea mangrovi TaxID=2572245 RepID=A0A4U1B598_9GAMM|nr:hypothetical protein [Thalassotalea mangrovi]TKB45500.1 hypothetical protein E8M12_08405 [Thalassotalea mangrovi]